MEKLQEFLLELPEAKKPVLGDAERPEVHDRAKESEVGVGVANGAKAGEFETVLEGGDDNNWAIECFGQVGEGVGGGAHAGKSIHGRDGQRKESG